MRTVRRLLIALLALAFIAATEVVFYKVNLKYGPDIYNYHYNVLSE